MGVGGGLDTKRERKEKNHDHSQVPGSSKVWMVGPLMRLERLGVGEGQVYGVKRGLCLACVTFQVSIKYLSRGVQ